MKIIPLALGFLATAGATLSVTLFLSKSRLEQALTHASAQVAGLQADLNSATRRQTTLEERLASATAELAETRARVAAADERAVQATREAGDLRSRLAAGAETTARLQAEAGELREALALSKLEVSSAGADEIAAYEATIAALEERIAGLEAAAAPAPLEAVASEPPAPAAPVPVASVGPDSAFVVLAYGAEDGARPAQTLAIRRGTQTLATVLITEVHARHAIAQVQPDTLRGGLHPGDLAAIAFLP